MVQGKPLDKKEQNFILENSGTMFASQIAKELSAKFSLDNGGYRSERTVKDFLKD